MAHAVNMALAQRRADKANPNILSLLFFIFRLTVLQLKFYFKCHLRLLNYISTGRTQQQIPLLRQCPSLYATKNKILLMKQISMLLCVATLFLSCNSSPTYTKAITIDSTIKKQVLNNVTKYNDNPNLNGNNFPYSNKLMMQLYLNDTSLRSTYESPHNEPFQSSYFWNKDTLVINGTFGLIAFEIEVYKDTVKVEGVIDNNFSYKRNINDSIHQTLHIPTTESKLILSQFPDKTKNDPLFGYVEFKETSIYYVQPDNFIPHQEKPIKQRKNMKVYFISEKSKD